VIAPESPVPAASSGAGERPYLIDRVGDAAVVQIYADGFARLPLRDKTLAWHLYQAALAGRDICYDQRYAHNLDMRALLEALLHHGSALAPHVLAELRRYTKLFWINTGPFNNLTARKFLLQLSREQLTAAAGAAVRAGAVLPQRNGESIEALIDRLAPAFFDAAADPVLTNKTPGAGRDILQASANNLYVGVTMADVSGFVERYGLNSRLVKQPDGTLVEEVYRAGGRYDREIRRIVSHLRDAIAFAPASTVRALEALIRFYETGEEQDRMAYDVAWVQDRESAVDTINGFVEVYLDPRGTKGAWEALVYYVNEEKTAKIQTLAAHAQWFEDHMPWEPRFRKPQVHGVTARAVDVVIETGDSGPLTPIGINLPNDQSVRERHGSKSVSLSNVTEAYDNATPEELRTEFAWDGDEAARAKRWGRLAQELTTEMHEVIGHGSGRMREGVSASPHLLLRELYSTIEEARADLVALYFLPHPRLVELGILNAADHADIVRAEYEHFTRTALVQLRRVREGTHLEEDHMRNRQLIVRWLMAHTRAIEVRTRDDKTYYVVVDPQSFRDGAGRLLAEVQRIKGEGDYAAARALVEKYGVHFDPALRDEVVARVDALRLPSYTAFVMPRLEPVRDAQGRITDVAISYPRDLERQMLEYSQGS
jgi:dipeptidyl-peptidase-3